MELTALRCEPVFVGQFNRMAEATRNKSSVLFGVTSRLLMYLWQRAPKGQLCRIYVDRQGGRMRYLPLLQRTFEGFQFKVLDETDALSAYRLGDRDKSMEIYFAVGAEDRQLPVALASMTSKYLRELFMLMFNGFWAQRVGRLAPTAGYYTDGRRFFNEIHPAIRQMGFDERMIYRSR